MRDRARETEKGITIRTVATAAGVSAMTVSNVVNGRPNVSEATRRKVVAAIDQLGYRPNAAARRLASPSSSRLGLVYARPDSAFVCDTVVGAVVATSDRGVQLLARDCGAIRYEELADLLRALVGAGAAALLLVPPFAEAVSGQPIVGELGVPIGAISTGCSFPDLLTVRIDEQAAACAMTRLLLDRGHRRIGFISGPVAHSGSRARSAGFLQAMRERNVAAPDELLVRGDYDFDSGIDAAERLLGLAERPTAIFAANDEMAAAAAWTAHRLGISLPRELALAGFDDSPIAKRVFPSLTAVRQPIAAMAQHVTSLLIDAMGHRPRQPRTGDVVFDFSIVERQSILANTAI